MEAQKGTTIVRILYEPPNNGNNKNEFNHRPCIQTTAKIPWSPNTEGKFKSNQTNHLSVSKEPKNWKANQNPSVTRSRKHGSGYQSVLSNDNGKVSMKFYTTKTLNMNKMIQCLPNKKCAYV